MKLLHASIKEKGPPIGRRHYATLSAEQKKERIVDEDGDQEDDELRPTLGRADERWHDLSHGHVWY